MGGQNMPALELAVSYTPPGTDLAITLTTVRDLSLLVAVLKTPSSRRAHGPRPRRVPSQRLASRCRRAISSSASSGCPVSSRSRRP